MQQKESYDVLRLIEHGQICYISSENVQGRTLVSASTMEQTFKDMKGTGNQEAAKAVGKLVAERALAQGISAVVFDRGGHVYHGRVKVLAEAAREAGLKF